MIDRISLGDMLMMPPKALKEQGVPALLAKPVGTGPFKFGEWVRDEKLVVVRNDDYWKGKALLKPVTFRFIPEFSARLAALTGVFVFLGFNRYRILAVTPNRIVVLDAGKSSMKTARGVVTELPRSTRLGPGSGVWHQVLAGNEKLRVHRRFYKDMETADRAVAPV